MKRDDQEQLLNELLVGEEVSDFRRISRDRALDAMQRRKRHRHFVLTGVVVGLPVLLLTALFLVRSPKPGARSEGRRAPAPARVAPAPARSGSVKVITDEELFALFPDRAMALIGAPGHQRLVFLDQPAPKRSARRL